ncbi:MAG: extracellular solute-binding protein [Bacilli bacterium]|jgi:arabinogalactan oligomer/maltooligosaccharide transport system substrate-binding protein
MKSTKYLVSLLGVVAMAVTGCGGTSSTPSASNTSSSAADHGSVKLTLTIAGPEAQADFNKARVQEYLTDNGYTNVKFTYMNMGEDVADTAVTDWSTGPDIYAFASDKILNLAKKGALSTVPTTYVTNMTNDMNSSAITAGTLGEKVVAYPYAGDNGYFLYYNTDLVPADKTDSVEHIIAACEAKSVKFAYPLNTAFYSMAELMTWGSRFGVTMSDDGTAIDSITADFNTDKGLKAAKAMKQMIDSDTVSHAAGCQAAPTAANKVGAVVDGSWNAGAYKKAVGDKLGACKLPTITVGGETKNLTSFLGYKLYGVNSVITQKDTTRAALDHAICNYLVSEKVQSARFDTFATAPTNKAVAALDKVKNDICVKAIADQSTYAVPQTVVPGNAWTAPVAVYTGLVDGTISTDEQITAALATLNQSIINSDKN